MAKKRRGANTTARRRRIGEDLISKLPDEVLTHILSYLSTQSSVKTSVLSKRWSRLWISVPNLDFGFCNFSCPVRQVQFDNFMDRFLSLNTVRSVRMIKLQLERDFAVSRVNSWLSAFGDLDAEKVDLVMPVNEDYSPICSLPDSFFNQNNLVKLKLDSVFLKVPQLVCFPKLKEMHLDSVRLSDETSMKYFLCGSPVLKTLDMYLGDQGGNVQTLHFCSTSLRNLILQFDVEIIHQFDVVINSPNLTFLSLTDYVHSTYNIINASLLASARLCNLKGEELLKLLTQISHVKELHISDYLMRALPDTLHANLPMLRNLNHLKVEIDEDDGCDDCGSFSRLLHCTPNIVNFSIVKDCSENIYGWFEPYEVPQCFLSSIESVDIKWVGDGDHDLQMIAYILKNAMVLNKLSILCHRDCYSPYINKCDGFKQVNETKFLTTLLTLPRSSTTCQVEYKLH